MITLQHTQLPAPVAPGTVVSSAQNLTYVRGGRAILDGLSLDIHAGEVIAILGPNGAGKSTLMGMLSGDLTPDSGNVSFLGQPLESWSLIDLARRRSVLLQDNQLLFSFTVREVVEMGRSPWRKTPAERDDWDVVSEAMAETDTTHLENRSVPTLSGGERARTALARVFAGQTGMLMLDEPTAALDLGHQESVLRLVRERAAAGDAVLVVLHALNAAAACSDRIALLRDGQVAALGAPDDVLTSDTLTDVYGTPIEVVPHPVTGHGIVIPVRR